MIVECFGPSGAGKTAFSLALASCLRGEGVDAFTSLSAGPSDPKFNPPASELLDPPPQLFSMSRRLMGRAFEPSASGDGRNSASFLAQAMPRRQILRGIRMRQYLTRLFDAWANAAASKDVWIFDQAYIQAVASILRVQHRVADDDVVALLDFVPHADLAIQVRMAGDDPEGLGQSQQGARVLARLFEDNGGDFREQSEIANRIAVLLNQAGRQVICVQSGGAEQLEAGVSAARRQVLAMRHPS